MEWKKSKLTRSYAVSRPGADSCHKQIWETLIFTFQGLGNKETNRFALSLRFSGDRVEATNLKQPWSLHERRGLPTGPDAKAQL